MKYSLLVLTIVLLCACAGQHTPITRDQAIQRARDIATINLPEIKATNGPPTNIRAKRMTFQQAAIRVWNADTVPTGQDPQRLVWLVTLDGEWRNAPPMPTDMPTQTSLKHSSLIVDATTGDSLGSSFTP